MVRKSKNVSITTPNVVVNTGKGVVNAKPKPQRVRRRGPKAVTGSLTPTILAEIQEMDSGKMVNEGSDLSFIRQLRGGRCVMDSNTAGWYAKVMDPAGAVETGRAVGECNKIPDGLLTFSVDAEIRTVEALPVPRIEDDVEGPGHIPLDGATWSLVIFSYPMFRTNFIAVGNRFDKTISSAVASELAYALNNLLDYRATINSNSWSPFAQSVEDGWYYWIKPLPPTYDLADPVAGDQRTLTSWRMTCKSLTIESNTPTLIDQGFWVGGQYALDSSIVQQPTEQTQMVLSNIHARVTVGFNITNMANARYTIRIPNLPQLSLVSGPATLNATSDSLYINVVGDNSAGSGTPVTWVVAANTAMYNPFEIVFAEPGDTVSVSVTAGSGPPSMLVNFTSTNALAVPFSVVVPTDSPIQNIISVGAEGYFALFTDNETNLFNNRTSNQIEFPAYNYDQVAANNPKMEQHLMKETNGAYLVHRKMRTPVYKLTPASSFGPVQFTTPDYVLNRNTADGSGILDTFDANFSTAVCVIQGISHANVIIVKGYQGWEGVTNLNTPFGQFGHSGLPRDETVLTLVDNLNTRTTGVYPANDNFLGLIAKFAAGALRNILSSEATPALLGNLAQGAINKGVTALRDRVARRRQMRTR